MEVLSLRPLRLAAVALALGVCGCDDEIGARYPVEGQVILDGFATHSKSPTEK